MEITIIRVLTPVIALLIGFLILKLLKNLIEKSKGKKFSINGKSALGVIFIIGGIFNIYIGVSEESASILLGIVLIIGSYFFIKQSQIIKVNNH